MATTNDILSFALKNKIFTRKELAINLKSEDRISSRNSLSEQLDRLLKSRQLIRTKRGVYSLPENTKKEFWIACSDEMRTINRQIKIQFPFVDYCLWSSSVLAPYMHHIPSLNFVMVDVERDISESVFNFLNSESDKRVFFMPSLVEFERYINANETIIVRPLISESPLQLIDGINTPGIEKILVDIAGDVEFSFLQGMELNNVYATIFERHNVNKNKLLRYATRRGRKEEIEQLINDNNL